KKLVKSKSLEVSVENSNINLPDLSKLCKSLPKRYPDLKLTVNDVLILYRCHFGHEYQSSTKLEDALFELRTQTSLETQAVADLIDDTIANIQAKNPSIVIPMEAKSTQPRERLYPTTFRNPFTELWSTYQTALATLNKYDQNQTQEDWVNFSEARRLLLIQLNYFGQLLR
ncbi:MAG: hypothetical protein GY951_15270, partial [Psychromonas sp.]|nr:hypothetical protein [Psychromonas sp.]